MLKLPVKSGNGLPAERFLRTKHIESVNIRMIDVRLCLHSGGLQVFNILQRLTVKRLTISNKGVARRQPLVIGLLRISLRRHFLHRPSACGS